jgi:hypothetical protein
MKFIENIVDENFKNKIKRILFDKNFRWLYQDSTIKNFAKIDDSSNIMHFEDTVHFTHILFEDTHVESDSIEFVQKILNNLNDQENILCTTLISAKCNVLSKGNDVSDLYYTPYANVRNILGENIYTLIYYVNDCDGDSIIFNEAHSTEPIELTVAHTQTPREGCAILFKGNTYNSSKLPTNEEGKATITIIFETNEEISW